MWNFLLLGCQQVGFWCWCTWFGFLGPSKFDRTTNQGQLCGSWTQVSLWDFFPFIIILITASLSSNTYNKASWCEDRTFEGTQSMLFSTLVFPWDLWLLSVITGLTVLSLFWVVFPRTKTIRSHKSRAGIPFNLNPASKEMISDSVWTVWNWSLLLTHPTYWNKCMTSKKRTKCSTWCSFWILKIFCKIGVLKQSQSALFCSVTHIAILSVFTCMMNVRNQSIQASVTGFGPFCDRSCKFVHWP